MTPQTLLFAYFISVILAIGACAGLRGRARSVIASGFVILGSVTLLACAISVLLRRSPLEIDLWRIGPAQLRLSLTSLGSLFVLLTAVVIGACFPFAAASHEGKATERDVLNRVYLSEFLLFYVALVLVVTAGDVLSFAFWWEIVSLLIYGLVLFRKEDVRSVRAAYSALAMSEVGSLAGIVGLLLLAFSTGQMTFAHMGISASHVSEPTRWVIFLLTFYGFGVKSGLVPVNQWVSDAYTAAPASFSPVLAGAASNLGIYAILLTNAQLMPVRGAGPGLVALSTGALGAIIGIVYAATQTDLKRALAHSSIENFGIIAAGIGAGFVFQQTGHAVLAAMAFAAALYHLVNHSLAKTTLFLGAAGIEQSTGTHDLNQLGGLLKRLPAFGLFFLVGVFSIAAVPPFNGFVSEWLTLQTVLRSVELASRSVRVFFVLAGALLALAAGLALTCFIMIFSSAFLGMARSGRAREISSAPRSAVWAMGLLAALCLLLGIGPTYVIPALDHVVVPITGARAADTLVPPFFRVTPASPGPLSSTFVSDFHDLGAQVGRRILPGRGLVILHQGGTRNPVVFAMSTAYTLIVLAGLLVLVAFAFRMLTAHRRTSRSKPWVGGLPQLFPQMTYNATGFAAPVRVIFEAVFRPLRTQTTETVAGHFRTSIRLEEIQEHILDRTVTRPVLTGLLWVANHLRKLHHGKVNVYAAYVLLSLLLVLLLGIKGF